MERITIQTTVNAPLQLVWIYWTDPQHIVNWNFASDDWHSPSAENDLRVGGKFLSRMEARDGSFGFDFGGIYTEVEEFRRIAYDMTDERSVEADFSEKDGKTTIMQTFDPEQTNPIEMQRDGWQAIMENFRKYAEKSYAEQL